MGSHVVPYVGILDRVIYPYDTAYQKVDTKFQNYICSTTISPILLYSTSMSTIFRTM